VKNAKEIDLMEYRINELEKELANYRFYRRRTFKTYAIAVRCVVKIFRALKAGNYRDLGSLGYRIIAFQGNNRASLLSHDLQSSTTRYQSLFQQMKDLEDRNNDLLLKTEELEGYILIKQEEYDELHKRYDDSQDRIRELQLLLDNAQGRIQLLKDEFAKERDLIRKQLSGDLTSLLARIKIFGFLQRGLAEKFSRSFTTVKGIVEMMDIPLEIKHLYRDIALMNDNNDLNIIAPCMDNILIEKAKINKGRKANIGGITTTTTTTSTGGSLSLTKIEDDIEGGDILKNNKSMNLAEGGGNVADVRNSLSSFAATKKVGSTGSDLRSSVLSQVSTSSAKRRDGGDEGQPSPLGSPSRPKKDRSLGSTISNKKLSRRQSESSVLSGASPLRSSTLQERIFQMFEEQYSKPAFKPKYVAVFRNYGNRFINTLKMMKTQYSLPLKMNTIQWMIWIQFGPTDKTTFKEIKALLDEQKKGENEGTEEDKATDDDVVVSLKKENTSTSELLLLDSEEKETTGEDGEEGTIAKKKNEELVVPELAIQSLYRADIESVQRTSAVLIDDILVMQSLFVHMKSHLEYYKKHMIYLKELEVEYQELLKKFRKMENSMEANSVLKSKRQQIMKLRSSNAHLLNNGDVNAYMQNVIKAIDSVKEQFGNDFSPNGSRIEGGIDGESRYSIASNVTRKTDGESSSPFRKDRFSPSLSPAVGKPAASMKSNDDPVARKSVNPNPRKSKRKVPTKIETNVPIDPITEHDYYEEECLQQSVLSAGNAVPTPENKLEQKRPTSILSPAEHRKTEKLSVSFARKDEVNHIQSYEEQSTVSTPPEGRASIQAKGRSSSTRQNNVKSEDKHLVPESFASPDGAGGSLIIGDEATAVVDERQLSRDSSRAKEETVIDDSHYNLPQKSSLLEENSSEDSINAPIRVNSSLSGDASHISDSASRTQSHSLDNAEEELNQSLESPYIASVKPSALSPQRSAYSLNENSMSSVSNDASHSRIEGLSTATTPSKSHNVRVTSNSSFNTATSFNSTDTANKRRTTSLMMKQQSNSQLQIIKETDDKTIDDLDDDWDEYEEDEELSNEGDEDEEESDEEEHENEKFMNELELAQKEAMAFLQRETELKQEIDVLSSANTSLTISVDHLTKQIIELKKNNDEMNEELYDLRVDLRTLTEGYDKINHENDLLKEIVQNEYKFHNDKVNHLMDHLTSSLAKKEREKELEKRRNKRNKGIQLDCSVCAIKDYHDHHDIHGLLHQHDDNATIAEVHETMAKILGDEKVLFPKFSNSKAIQQLAPSKAVQSSFPKKAFEELQEYEFLEDDENEQPFVEKVLDVLNRHSRFNLYSSSSFQHQDHNLAHVALSTKEVSTNTLHNDSSTPLITTTVDHNQGIIYYKERNPLVKNRSFSKDKKDRGSMKCPVKDVEIVKEVPPTTFTKTPSLIPALASVNIPDFGKQDFNPGADVKQAYEKSANLLKYARSLMNTDIGNIDAGVASQQKSARRPQSSSGNRKLSQSSSNIVLQPSINDHPVIYDLNAQFTSSAPLLADAAAPPPSFVSLAGKSNNKSRPQSAFSYQKPDIGTVDYDGTETSKFRKIKQIPHGSSNDQYRKSANTLALSTPIVADSALRLDIGDPQDIIAYEYYHHQLLSSKRDTGIVSNTAAFLQGNDLYDRKAASRYGSGSPSSDLHKPSSLKKTGEEANKRKDRKGKLIIPSDGDSIN
jgi:hypothetical protein